MALQTSSAALLVALLLVWPALLTATLSDSFRNHLINNGLLQGEESRSEVRIWPTRISFKSILDEFVGNTERDNFVINLGAQDGDNYDPVFELLLQEKGRSYSGIFIEASKDHEMKLLGNVRLFNQSGQMNAFIEYALPNTIVSRLVSANCPLNPDVLKVDIDSVDLPIMQAIFQTSNIRPKVVMAEVNSDIPPPFIWYQREIRKKRSQTFYGNYGTGVYALYNLMDLSGYVPVGVELGSNRGNCLLCEHNLFFVTKELYQNKANDKRYDITFLDFSKSFWINLLQYSNNLRKHSRKEHQKALRLNINAVSCIQLFVDRCPYTLMQRFGQKHVYFQNRDFTKWQTWFDLQLFLMSFEGNETATKVSNLLYKDLRRLDLKSGVMHSDDIYIQPNSLVSEAYSPHFDTTLPNSSNFS